jgi:hypothetical protein
MRKIVMMGWLLALISVLVALFWYTDWRYSLPTPVPVHYQPVVSGAAIALGQPVRTASGKPIFLHFFNPSCPCSRFNMPYFQALVRRFGDKVDFAIVVLSDKKYTAKEIRDKFSLQVPVFFDSSMAKACGVYSTPQAVIIDSADQLYYRGNYNRSRYCTDNKTNYAEMALSALLKNDPNKLKDPYALRAYGCSLPNCTK